MLHILRAEFYQIRHRRAPMILLLLVFGISVAAGWIALSAARSFGMEMQGQAVASASYGAQLLFAYVILLRTLPLMLSFIALLMTFNNEVKNRTLINTVSFGFRRRTIVVGKVIAALVYLFVASCLSYAGLLLGISFGGGSLQGVDLLNFFTSYLIPSLPLFAAYIALFAIPAFLFGSTGPQIILYLVLSALNSILVALYAWATTADSGRRFGSNIINEAEHFFRYFFTFLNQAKPLTFGRLNFDFMPVIALAYACLFLLIGCKLFNRSEVK